MQKEDLKKIKPFLITVSLYITAFELLKNSINHKVESFFMLDTHCRNFNHRAEYEKEMQPYRAAHKEKKDRKTYVHLDWLIDQNVITKKDVEQYDVVRRFRNDLAHELLNLVGENFSRNYGEMQNLYKIMLDLITKIERFWVINVDVPCNPEFDQVEILPEDVIPGPVIAMQMLVNAAFDDG